MICGNCENDTCKCPECKKEFEHGEVSQCDNLTCIAVNAPLDCKGCGFVVSSELDGVLNFDMELIPYESE